MNKMDPGGNYAAKSDDDKKKDKKGRDDNDKVEIAQNSPRNTRLGTSGTPDAALRQVIARQLMQEIEVLHMQVYGQPHPGWISGPANANIGNREISALLMARNNLISINANNLVMGATSATDQQHSGSAVGRATTRVDRETLSARRAEFDNLRPTLWRAEAYCNPSNYSRSQLADMANGRAPIGSDGYRMEFHHRTALANGGTNTFDNIVPLTRTEHRLGENYRLNHPGLP